MAMSARSRYLVSELLVISRGITFNGLYQGNHNIQVSRTLYSASILGVDSYVQFRDRVQTQFVHVSDKFRSKMKQFNEPSCKSMVFTEDLKNMLHLIEPGNKEDLELIMIMTKCYNEQNKEMRFGSFCFGPVVMRMFHFLNEPSFALEAFKSPELDGFFDHMASWHVFMDLLFKNEMYQDILTVFDMIKKKQLQGIRYPRNNVLLAFAACYKINTPDSFKYAVDLWKEVQEVGHELLRRSVTFAAALAVNQNSPHIALEMLSTVGQPNYVTVRNIKLAAFAELGRPEDGFPILRQILETDHPVEPRAAITKDVIEKLRTSVATSGNDVTIREFQEMDKSLSERGSISDSMTLDDLLCKEIKGPVNQNVNKGHNRLTTEASFSRRRQNRPTGSFNRPGLQDLH